MVGIAKLPAQSTAHNPNSVVDYLITKPSMKRIITEA